MEIRVLQYFLTVAREGSITKAANMLHITQPTLSRQLAQLEADAGVALFHRGSRKITLTNEGLLLQHRAKEILALVDKTREELAQQEEQVEGTVSIGSGEMEAVELLAKLCRGFQEQYPRVRFDMYSATADLVKERMEKGLLDIGLLLEPVDMDEFEFIRMPVQEKWVALMRPDDVMASKNSVTAEDLASRSLILPRRLNVQSELANWFGDCFSKLNITLTGNLAANAVPMVREGLGCAVVVKSASLFWDEGKVVARPLSPPLTTTTVLAWRRGQLFGVATEKFIQYVKCFLSMEEP